MPNPVVHFEILGKDGKKTQQYYGSLFGWKIDANNPMSYGMVNNGGEGIDGGVAQAEQGQPAVTFYVQVDDPQKYLDKAIALGGKLIMPVTDVPEMVTMCQFADPDGNVIGIVKAM
jgi:predicted enzyme related to lactoylglutathione lyase